MNNNIIMLGAGGPQSHLHIQSLKKEGISFSADSSNRIVGCVNPDINSAQRFACEHGLGDVSVAKNMDELVAVFGDRARQVTCIVNTPVNTHIALLQILLSLHQQRKLRLAGVICEKLLGRDIARATAMAQSYEMAGIPLGVVCQKYFSSGVLLAQKLLADVAVFNATFPTHFSATDIAIVGVEVHFEKDRRHRSFQAKTNNLHHGKAPWTHFELPHMAAIVDAILGEIGTLESIDGHDMIAALSDVREAWEQEHPICVHGARAIIKHHAGGTATTRIGEKKVTLHSSLVNPNRRREVIITLANQYTLHIHLDPGETKHPESRLELRNDRGETLRNTESETDNSLGVCLKAMLDAIGSGAPIPSNARRHIGLLRFLDDADFHLGVN